MGKRIQLHCNQCGFEQIVSLGVGLGSRNETIVEACLKGMDLNFWKQLKQTGKIKVFSSHQELGYCKKCNKLHESFVVDIQTIDDKKLVLGDKCSPCNGKLQFLDIEKEVSCPVCKKNLDVNMIGLWD